VRRLTPSGTPLAPYAVGLRASLVCPGMTDVQDDTEGVTFEARGHVAVLTINRPAKRNAVNGAIAQGMEAAIDRLEDDDALFVAVLTHNGPVFSAGADLKMISEGKFADMATAKGGFAGIAARARTKPIIAAVDGPAFAGGCEIVLSCDMLVASTQAEFGIPEVKRSLVAAAGGVFRLPKLLPRNIALELGLTGDPISAERAHQLGMVNRLAEPGKALEAALDLADAVCKAAPLAVRETRKLMLETTLGVDDATGMRLSGEALGRLGATEDFMEGPTAFLEKRDPVWKGR
jgi:enoyl-CoA hydratase